MRSLAAVLRDTEDLIEQRKLSDKQSADLEVILSGCKDVLGDLNKKTKKFEGLDNDDSSQDQSTHDGSTFVSPEIYSSELIRNSPEKNVSSLEKNNLESKRGTKAPRSYCVQYISLKLVPTSNK